MTPDPPRAPARLWILRPTLGQGGADRVTLTLLRQLDRRRFAPTLVLMRLEGALLAELPPDVPLLVLGARSLWTASLPLARRMRRDPPDILFSTSSGANLVACLAHRLARSKARLVLSERNVLVRDRGALKTRVQIAAKRLLYPAADVVTAVSGGVRDDLERRLGLAAGSVSVVHNPVVLPELQDLAGETPDHPWFAANEPVVLAAGRLVGAKGFETLVEAFASLRRQHQARLLILGEGPLRSRLEERVRDLGLQGEVDLPGFVANPYAYMARCAVFALSSRFEGLPGVLIQAMACGAPVVATDCHAGPAEIVKPGVTGLLVPVDDAPAMAEALRSLLADPRLSERLAEAGRDAVLGRFQAGPVVEAYAKALRGTV